jgi:hypothetical protein
LLLQDSKVHLGIVTVKLIGITLCKIWFKLFYDTPSGSLSEDEYSPT